MIVPLFVLSCEVEIEKAFLIALFCSSVKVSAVVPSLLSAVIDVFSSSIDAVGLSVKSTSSNVIAPFTVCSLVSPVVFSASVMEADWACDVITGLSLVPVIVIVTF